MNSLSKNLDVWRTEDGRNIPVRKMDKGHVLNCINFLSRVRTRKHKYMKSLYTQQKLYEDEFTLDFLRNEIEETYSEISQIDKWLKVLHLEKQLRYLREELKSNHQNWFVRIFERITRKSL